MGVSATFLCAYDEKGAAVRGVHPPLTSPLSLPLYLFVRLFAKVSVPVIMIQKMFGGAVSVAARGIEPN